MKIDLEKFNQLVTDKLLSVQKHNTLDLLIWNYTQRTQFSKAWTEETMMARGLITDLGGNIIARPFRKFFNWEEKPEQIPDELPIIYEKFDGSLGVQYYDGDKVCIATRGSFNSDQAKWATEWIQKKGLTRKDFEQGFTYLYEIIYPENRIVVNYGNRSELVLLAAIWTETGNEYGYAGDPMLTPEREGERLRLSSAVHLAYNDLSKIVEDTKNLDGNQEGYVFHWPFRNNLRVKMKGKEYVRLHRLITGFSTKSIWECLMNEQNLDDILQNIPDEFYDWVREKEKELWSQFSKIRNDASSAYHETIQIAGRREKAIFLKEQYPEIMSEVFAMMDEKDWKAIIWKKLRPKFELPFKKDIDA